MKSTIKRILLRRPLVAAAILGTAVLLVLVRTGPGLTASPAPTPSVRDTAAARVRDTHSTGLPANPSAGPVLWLPSGSHRVVAEAKVNPFGSLNLQARAEAIPLGESLAAAHLLAVSKKAEVAPGKALLPKRVLEALPPEPAPPTAPALPFVAVGGIKGDTLEHGRPIAFLRRGDEVLVVRPGDEIAGGYRVEAVSDDRVEFTYLPLKTRQWLAVQP